MKRRDEGGKPVEVPVPTEVGGESLLLDLPAQPEVVFAVLHEPFENGAPQIRMFRELERTGQAVTLEVGGQGDPVWHRVVLPLGAIDGSGVRFERLGR